MDVKAPTITGMDAKTARTEHIRAAVREAGGPTGFLRQYGAGAKWTQAQVSQWISENEPKPIGHALARQLEARLRMAPGEMDRRPGSQPAGLDVYKLQVAIVSVRKALEKIVVVDEVKVANSIAYAYLESLPLPTPVPPDQMADFDALVRHNLRGKLADERREGSAVESSTSGNTKTAAARAVAGAGGRTRKG